MNSVNEDLISEIEGIFKERILVANQGWKLVRMEMIRFEGLKHVPGRRVSY